VLVAEKAPRIDLLVFIRLTAWACVYSRHAARSVPVGSRRH
jgi:hypothetical protein